MPSKRIIRIEANEEEIKQDEKSKYEPEEKPQTLEELEKESMRFLNYMNNRTETAKKLIKDKGWKPSALSLLVRDQKFRNEIMSKLFLPLTSPIKAPTRRDL